MNVEAILAWFKEYWMYAVVLVIVCIIAGFVFKKAAAAYKAHQKSFHEQEATMRRLRALKDRYRNLTAEIIADAPAEELLEGVALRDQIFLQKQDNMTAAFAALPRARQYVYALDVFVADRTAKDFFTKNGKELVSIIAPAIEMIGLAAALPTMRKLAVMFDEDDETTSVDYHFVEEADAEFDKIDLLTQIKLQGAQYIKDHPDEFVENSELTDA